MCSPRHSLSTRRTFPPTGKSGAPTKRPASKRPPSASNDGAGMIRGMTGFGRSQGQAAWGAWAWEVRSVNGKTVDLRTNLPPGCEAVDFEARRRVKEKFQRGSFQVQLRIDFTRDGGGMAIDTRELARLARLSRNWSSRVQPATFNGLLNTPSVVRGPSRTGQTVDEAAQKELLESLEAALDMLIKARLKEGEALEGLFNRMLVELERLIATAG